MSAPVDRTVPLDLHDEDIALGIRLLRKTPTNETRSHALLEQVSRAAHLFGRDLARTAVRDSPRPEVREHSDGLAADTPVVARYLPRADRIDLFIDVVEHCESVVDARGLRSLFPPGSIRAAALLHEQAHALIGHRHAAALRRALQVPALRLGRFVRWAHVAGADELAAHAFAQTRLDLSRSPLLVTAAAAETLDGSCPAPHPSLKED